MKLAAIDIGTHSVLLLIAEKNPDGTVKVLADEATLTRIGEGLGSSDYFAAGGMERTLAVLKKYRLLCDQHNAEKILAVGTAAFRKAANAGEFVRRVEKECGISIEIISGEREAALTWKACETDFGGQIMVVDVGGGSTEIITPSSLQKTPPGATKQSCNLQTISLPIGSVILTEKFCHSDPISENDYQNICQTIEKELLSVDLNTSILKHLNILIAPAGTATTLGAIQKKMKVYKHHEIHGLKLPLTVIQNIIRDFKSKTIEERKKIVGLEPGRADVILAGATLLSKIASHFGFKEITVSDRGVRWGVVYELFQIH